jgi:FKBP-type peptidyl-prolyl cis-trans isomerase
VERQELNMADTKKQSKYVSNEELLAPLQAAFDKYEKKKADEKAKVKEERDASRKASMTMDEMDFGVSKRAGGMISSASKRADGCAIRGKTKA